MCTLYPVFKEPRLRRFRESEPFGIPATTPSTARDAVKNTCPAFAFVSVAPFRGTFQLYKTNLAMSTLFVSAVDFSVVDAKSMAR